MMRTSTKTSTHTSNKLLNARLPMWRTVLVRPPLRLLQTARSSSGTAASVSPLKVAICVGILARFRSKCIPTQIATFNYIIGVWLSEASSSSASLSGVKSPKGTALTSVPSSMASNARITRQQRTSLCASFHCEWPCGQRGESLPV